MAIETLDDIIDEILDKMGVWDGHDPDKDDSDPCNCRCCMSSNLSDRIRRAIKIEIKLNGEIT